MCIGGDAVVNMMIEYFYAHSNYSQTNSVFVLSTVTVM